MPRQRPSLIPRPHLIDKLNQGMGKLTLVSAPPGFGKTTSVVAWLNQLTIDNYPVAWLSLDEHDNDLTRFLTYVVAALQRGLAQDDFGQAALVMLQSAQAPPIEPVLSVLLNELTSVVSTAVSQPLFLALDDYHHIQTEAIHQAIAFLIDHLPPHCHIIMISRADPPFPLAQMRLRQELTEIRAADLRFTAAETAAFFKATLNRTLSPTILAALEERTEGWIAGLQAVALSLSGRSDIHTFIQSFSGSHRYILDYLAEEVLHRQPEFVQTFLLQTAVPDRICAGLCQAITEIGDWRLEIDASVNLQSPISSQKLLEHLESANLFLIPLDDNRRWYRFHPLFKSFLVSQLAAEEIPELHRRAAVWFEQHDLIDEAITHFLTAADWDRAAHLIEQNARIFLMRGEGQTVRKWIAAFPKEVVRARPDLSLAHAAALTFMRDREGVAACLADIEHALAHNDDLTPQQINYFSGTITAYRAMMSAWESNNLRHDELQRALAQLPENETVLHSLTSFLLGLAYRIDNALPQAIESFTAVHQLSQKTGDIMLALTALNHLAGVYEVQGKLRQAAQTHRQAIRVATSKSDRLFPIAGAALVGLAKIHRRWNELETAATHLNQAIQLAQAGGLHDVLLDAAITRGLVCREGTDWAGAHKALDEAEEIIRRGGHPQALARTAVFRAQVWLAQGRLADVARWAQESGLTVDDKLSDWLEVAHLTLARYLIQQGRDSGDKSALDAAMHLLNRLQQMAAKTERQGSLIEILVIQASAQDAAGDTVRALKTVGQALSLAQPEGYIRLFVNEGQPMATLIAKIETADPALKSYIRKLLAAFKTKATLQHLIEPLSPREQEVLRLVAAGLSNREIAAELVIAVSTVKRHINHIYGKMAVHSRTQAVARARELNLL